MDHKEEMAARRIRQRSRTLLYPTYTRDQKTGKWRFAGYNDAPFPIRANLGRQHPDYGLHPKEHARRKAARA